MIDAEVPLDSFGAQGGQHLFLAVLPRNTDTCDGISIRFDGLPGEPRDLTKSNASGVPLPGHRPCARTQLTNWIGYTFLPLFEGLDEMLDEKASVRPPFLAFSQTPRDPPGPVSNLMGRKGLAGRSAQGRKIFLRQWGDPAVGGELLVFSCIHGDECAAREIQPISGCPSPDADIYRVNLNPDGLEEGTRLNGRGVDLNRNFPVEWKPIGTRGGAQYSGPRPFSEPETRLAARIIRRLDPETTIWFHQHAGPAFVRAWGQSVSAARRYARLARLPFRRLPWLAGTAPNWQNNTFPGTSSFVVELPDGPLAPRRLSGLGLAANKLAREQADLP